MVLGLGQDLVQQGHILGHCRYVDLGLGLDLVQQGHVLIWDLQKFMEVLQKIVNLLQEILKNLMRFF